MMMSDNSRFISHVRFTVTILNYESGLQFTNIIKRIMIRTEVIVNNAIEIDLLTIIF